MTSANLTGTAFAKRFEVGILLSDGGEKEIVDLYEKWWNNQATNLPAERAPKPRRQVTAAPEEEPSGEALPDRWPLPPPPEMPADAVKGSVGKPSRDLGAPKVATSEAELQRIHQAFPDWKGKMKTLRALASGPKQKQELDRMFKRGTTAKTAARYKHDYVRSAIETINRGFDRKKIGFRIELKGTMYRLVRVERPE